MYFKRRKTAQNNLLLVSILVTLVISLFLVYNASSTYAYNYFGSSYYFLVNQFIWVCVGLLAFFFVQILPFETFKKTSFLLYVIAVVFLLLVLIPSPFSVEVYGARRWLVLNPEPFPAIPFLGRLSFQPAEFAKLATCLVLPLVFLSTREKASTGSVAKLAGYFLLPALLILVEPDLKDALILCIVGASIIFAGGIDFKYFLYAIPIALFLLLMSILLSPYRLERVKTYFSADHSDESSYHAKQLNIALGSGGVFGVGVGKSRQKNEYLPEVVGDSIFAIFGEEFGFIGSTLLVFLISLVFYSIYKSTLIITDMYERLFSVGVLSWYGAQAFLNMGSISGLIPLTGVPLPLISYGGSSLLFMLTALAIVYKYSKS